jgi:transcriptional regulator with GAF, ATPase, and Fis domain
MIVGEHPLVQKIVSLVRKVAPSDVTVLITGESGTGKELVARALHAWSRRAERPFVPVNCAAIPPDLMESELFGHVRGAFTGATQARAGIFQLAEGGTIFLDEIAEMPFGLQAKLLRALQSGEIRPVGADRSVTVDVRVIAATNRDLEREVANGGFREDLYYRLQVVPIHLPPLRARRSDIPLLVRHFLEKAQRKYHRSAEIEPEAMVHFWEYDWPGNVRELENLIERLVVLDDDGRIGLKDLPANIRAFLSEKKAPSPILGEGAVDLRLATKRFEYRLIDEALRLANGNKARASRMLNLKRTTLVAKLRSRSRFETETPPRSAT